MTVAASVASGLMMVVLSFMSVRPLVFCVVVETGRPSVVAAVAGAAVVVPAVMAAAVIAPVMAALVLGAVPGAGGHAVVARVVAGLGLLLGLVVRPAHVLARLVRPVAGVLARLVGASAQLVLAGGGMGVLARLRRERG